MSSDQRGNDQIRILEHAVGPGVMLSVVGAVDMLTAPQLTQRVHTVLQRNPAALIVDLSRVDFLGSAGISVLVDGFHNAGPTAYAVVADGPATARPLHLLAIDQVINVYRCVADAIGALGISDAETG